MAALTQLALATDDGTQWRARITEANGALKKRATLQAVATERTEQAFTLRALRRSLAR